MSVATILVDDSEQIYQTRNEHCTFISDLQHSSRCGNKDTVSFILYQSGENGQKSISQFLTAGSIKPISLVWNVKTLMLISPLFS
jgi:hypothetical protein